MKMHTLKTWPKEFAAIVNFTKTFEVRNNNRNFQENDIVMLREWNPETETYTERMAIFEIGHVMKDCNWGLPEGLCVFSLLRLVDSESIAVHKLQQI